MQQRARIRKESSGGRGFIMVPPFDRALYTRPWGRLNYATRLAIQQGARIGR